MPQSFSFVNLDGPNLVPDAQVRRRIRQQAMRDTAVARKQRGDYGKHNMRQYPVFVSPADGSEPARDAPDPNELQRIRQSLELYVPFPFQDPRMPKEFSLLLNLMPLTGLRLGVGTLSHYLYEPTQPKDAIVTAQASSQRLLSFIPSRYGHVQLLRHATDSVIAKLQYLSQPEENRSSKGDLKALMHYQKALKALQEALLDEREWAKPETLCATQLLGIFEALNGNEKDSWMQHVGGAARLVEARGAHMFTSEFEKALFLSHIGPTVMSAFLSNTPCFLEQSQWQAVIREAVNEDATLSNDKEFVLALWGGLIELPRLFKDTTALLMAPCPPPQKVVDDLIERLLAKRKNLMIWLTLIRKNPIVNNGGLVVDDDNGVLIFSTDFDYKSLGPWCLTRIGLRGTYAVCRMVKSRLLYALSPEKFQHLETEAQDIARRILDLQDDMAAAKQSALIWNQFMAQGSWIAKGIVETKSIWGEKPHRDESMLERWKFEKWNKVIGRKIS